MTPEASRSGDQPTLDVGDLVALVETQLAALWGNEAAHPVAALRAHPALVGLVEAIEYSVLAPGKRIRPVLVLAAAEACGYAPTPAAARVAAAFELIHAYSLVHDDLPCMDDDDVRRGRPTSHRRFGEGTALLVGDALQAAAFEVVAGGGGDPLFDAASRLELVRVLAESSGWRGMVGGQYLDVLGDRDREDEAALRELHGLKTGALLRAAVEAGAILAGADPAVRAACREFGAGLGWLFQLVDDLLDAVGDPEHTGRPRGSDERTQRVTAVDVYGLEGLRRAADEQLARCLDVAARLPQRGARLPHIARFVRGRDR